MTTFTQRVTLRIAVLVTVTTAVVLALGGWLLDRQMLRSIEVLHDAEYHELRTLIGSDLNLTAEELARRIAHDADSDAALYFIQVHSDRGAVIFRSPNLGPNVLPDLSGREMRVTLELPGIGPVHSSEFHDGPWHVQVASPLAGLRLLLRDYVRVSVLLLVGVGLVSVAVGYGFSRATLRPIRAIEATANRIRSDNLSERIPVPASGDELASLTRLLNQMFDRLQASFEQVRRFTADASHELKTPLALIRLNAEKVRARVAGDPDATAAVADILEEIAQLNQVIDRLLFLAKSESGALQLALRPVALPALLQPFAEDAQALAEDRGVHFALASNVAGEIRADPELLRQMLLNLVANAVTVTPRGGWVTLDSSPAGASWRLSVRDEGPGLPGDQLARVFHRFVRFERAGEPGGAGHGHGLGLAICRSIVELHGGTIRAENRSDRSGLDVIVELPR